MLRLTSFFVLLCLFLTSRVATASQLYDPFQGGKIVCVSEKEVDGEIEETRFIADFPLPQKNKFTFFKPSQILATTAVYEQRGFIFKSKTLRDIKVTEHFRESSEEISVCGKRLLKSPEITCKFDGGEGDGHPEVFYQVSCGISQPFQDVRLALYYMVDGQVRIDCLTGSQSTFTQTKLMGCKRQL